MKFMNDAPDHQYLGLKVILIFGICGATRCKELKDLGVADVEDLGNKYFVTISDSKNGLARQFVIGGLFYERVKKYISLKPTDFTTERFFIQYHKGKCQRQVIGRNTIGLIPKNIAEYLELNNPKRYTGHCFRRTSATFLSNSGANTTMLKQLGGWKSTEIAQTYVQNSLKNRQRIFDNITHAATSNASTSNAQSNPQPSTSKNNAASAIGIDRNEASIPLEIGYDDFHEEFEVDNDALAELEKLIPPEESILPKEPTLPKKLILPGQSKQSPTFFYAGSKRKIVVNANSESIKPTHFMNKPPISVVHCQKENKPTERDNQASDLTSTHSAKIKDSSIKYENCVFHGNIVNNFYYSQNNDQAS
ncbi:uncharacterized protein LOC143896488 [Temnothorax americanus]|uniref:uncharacterized protein LOC143896488 n=1 Tax=Temnothorax americanus TaxID=1964332 RepID=UPI004067E026